ncbi:MAG: hypothetical protein ACYC9I_02915, partial [Desulfuromonadales bacterium]
MITGFAIMAPLLYGYIMPCIAINMLGQWRFKNGIMMGGMYVHHGFIYAWKLCLLGYLPILILGKNIPDIYSSVAWVMLSASSYAFYAWLEDLFCLNNGYVGLNSDDGSCEPKRGNLEYAPICFLLIGGIYSVGLVTIYVLCLSGAVTWLYYVLVIIVTALLLASLPAFAYALSKQNHVK